MSVSVAVIIKPDGERYIYLWDKQSTAQVFQAIAKHAANPDLSFNWHDAAIISQKVRRLEKEKI